MYCFLIEDHFRDATKMIERGELNVIHATFYRKEDGFVHMDMQGHAVGTPGVANPVCAAATMLAYTFGQSVQFLYENERLKEKPTIQIIDGYAHISARPKGEYQGDVLMAAWVVQAGVFCLSRNYPNDVLLTPMEVSDQ